MTNRILVAAVFSVGCAVGGVSSQLVVPKASAQQAMTLPAWEYQCVAGSYDERIAAAQRMGWERWELVNSEAAGMSLRWCFKRQKV
jgi:hypothetical protein